MPLDENDKIYFDNHLKELNFIYIMDAVCRYAECRYAECSGAAGFD
jgi:hypothetical protein